MLDGAGNENSVFIFQTNSTLITASASTVTLINGAQECNVFWQVGSSATLGTGSVFRGNILALTSITVNTGVTVHGRALARNGAVTLDNDVFTSVSCASSGGSGGPVRPVRRARRARPARRARRVRPVRVGVRELRRSSDRRVPVAAPSRPRVSHGRPC